MNATDIFVTLTELSLTILVILAPVFLLPTLLIVINKPFHIYYKKFIFILGLTYLLMFIVAVAIPFYFYEYKNYIELWSSPYKNFGNQDMQTLQAEIAGSNNWVQNPVIQNITSFLSWGRASFLWLAMCILLIFYGELSLNKKYQYFIKVTLIVIACWLLTEAPNFELMENALN